MAPLRSVAANNWRGIGLMLLSTLCFSVMHASIRHMSASLHPFEIAFFRNLFGLLVVLPWFVRDGLAPLKTSRLRLHGLRAALNTVAMLSFFMALSLTPLTDVTALAFAAPVFATVLAILVFRETVGIRRWSAIALGFAGTLVVLRPGFQQVGMGPMLALGASLTWAFVLLVIKELGRSDSSVTITTYMQLFMAPLSLVAALFVWRTPDLAHVPWLVGIGLAGGCGQLLMAQALRQADTNVVMPFDFCKLIWVTVIAYVAFGEVPDGFTWAGGTMIFMSAAYIAYRERDRGRVVPAVSPPN
ncbi:MAG: DMT family transporter [Rhodospirillaceae bacterium]|nr:DMT family transporter [Rhodospirillaceae bacterium]